MYFSGSPCSYEPHGVFVVHVVLTSLVLLFTGLSSTLHIHHLWLTSPEFLLPLDLKWGSTCRSGAERTVFEWIQKSPTETDDTTLTWPHPHSPLPPSSFCSVNVIWYTPHCLTHLVTSTIFTSLRSVCNFHPGCFTQPFAPPHTLSLLNLYWTREWGKSGDESQVGWLLRPERLRSRLNPLNFDGTDSACPHSLLVRTPPVLFGLHGYSVHPLLHLVRRLRQSELKSETHPTSMFMSPGWHFYYLFRSLTYSRGSLVWVYLSSSSESWVRSPSVTLQISVVGVSNSTCQSHSPLRSPIPQGLWFPLSQGLRPQWPTRFPVQSVPDSWLVSDQWSFSTSMSTSRSTSVTQICWEGSSKQPFRPFLYPVSICPYT